MSVGHLLIIGETQSGKTHYANVLHRDCKALSIFFNTNNVSYVWGQRVRSLRQLQEAVAAGARHLCYEPPQELRGATQHLSDLAAYLFAKGREGAVWCQIVVDEAQRFEGTDSVEGPPEDMTRRLLGKGVRVVLITQYPVGLKPGTRTNCPSRVVFRPGIEGIRFLQSYGSYPVAEILRHTSQPRHYATYHPSRGWVTHPPL